MRRLFIPVVLCVLAVFPLAAQQKVIPLTSPFYEIVDTLYLVQGIAAPTSARPWTQSEAKIVLSRINARTFTHVQRGLYERAAAIAYESLRFGLDSIARFDAHVGANIEAYTHANSEDYVLDTDWIYGYTQRKPLLLIEAETSAGNFFYGRTDIGWNYKRFIDDDDAFRRLREALPEGVAAFSDVNETGKGWIAIHSKQYSRNFALNIASPDQGFDSLYPKRADFVLGGEHWNLGLYRDRLSWGNGHSGNFIFDDHTDYTDFFRFGLFTENFRYEWTTAFYNNDPYEYWSDDERIKIFMTHRVEFRLFNRLTAAASENVMYYDEQYNPANFNPAQIFHNVNKNEIFNALASLEADFAFLPGFNLYSQACLDQATTWTEEGTEEPPAWGILAGLEWARALGPGLFTTSFEAAYTSPALYRRQAAPDFVRAIVDWYNTAFDFIGYQYGGDALVFQLDASYLFPSGRKTAIRAFYMLHGGMNIYTRQTSDYDYTFPSGDENTHERTLAFTIKSYYPVTMPEHLQKWLSLDAWCQLDLLGKWNKTMFSETGVGEDFVEHKSGLAADAQFTVGVGVRF